jgi:hypothetical protein
MNGIRMIERGVRVAAVLFCSLAAILVGPVDAGAQDDDGWRIDFGPYLGYYTFDDATQFKDGGLFGFRLGVHRDHWFRFEAEFDEVYTSREPAGNAARQITLAVHGRFEPQHWRFAPSAFLGLGLVMFDDSDNPDAFGEGYDLGVGLAFRMTDSWRLRADYMARYQNFRVRDPNYPIDDPAALSSPTDLWGSSVRLGAFYDLPTEHNGAPAHYPLEFGAYAGYWNFSSTFRYQDDAVLGLRGGVGILRWFSLQLELDQITTSNERTNEWAQTISFAMHGLVEARAGATWRPGLLFGVAFMGVDNTDDIDTISEGFDLGPTLRLRGNDRIGMQADMLFRYQSVRVNGVDEDGIPTANPEVDYVWSYGIRLGVNVVF